MAVSISFLIFFHFVFNETLQFILIKHLKSQIVLQISNIGKF